MSLLDIFRRPKHPDHRYLTRDGRLASDLWLDQPDAHQRIDRRLAGGEITAEQADHLRHFVDRGYLVLPLELDQGIFTGIEEAVERLWRERPEDVSYAFHSQLRPFKYARPEHRKPSYRIADLHADCDEALALYLNRQIFDYLELIFEEPAVATQSLCFEWGSQQPLHRDPVFVKMTPPSHLLAAWIALEDIGPDCGPLIYLPGSHRLPYYQYEPGRYAFDFSRDSDADSLASQEWDQRQCSAAGLELETLTCRRGDVLIWHHSLLHGGSYPNDPELTRKSFVVHYSTLSSMDRVLNSYLEPSSDGGEETPRVLESRRILERDGCRGFDSPLHVHVAGRAAERG